MNVLITGPESTAKTTIATQLAAHYNAHLIPEEARLYLKETNGKYEYSDIRKIAERHVAAMKKVDDKRMNIFDTYLINLKIWSDRKFGDCDPYITEQLNKTKFSKVLLLYPDIDWEEDPLRESQYSRVSIFKDFQFELLNLSWPFNIVSGHGVTRLNRSIKKIDLT